MASTQTLTLKAVLDTSDVQAKLNQLRQQQIQMQATSNSAPTSNLGNLGNLGSILSRLNTTLNQLNTSVQRLANVGAKQNSPITATFGGNNVSRLDDLRARRALDSYSRMEKFWSKIITTQLTPQDLQEINQKHPGFNNAPYNILFGKGKVYQNAIDMVRDYLGPARVDAGMPIIREIRHSLKNYFGGTPSKEELGYLLRTNPKLDPNKEFNSRALKFYGGLAFGQISTAAQKVFAANGNDNFARGTGALGNVATATFMGASVGGAYGAAIGLAASSIAEALTYWADVITKDAKEAEEQIKESNTNAERASAFRKTRKEFAENTEYTNIIESVQDKLRDKISEARGDNDLRNMDLSDLIKLRAKIQRQADFYKTQLEEQDKVAKTGNVASNAMEFQQKYENEIKQLKQIDDLLKSIDEKQKAIDKAKKQWFTAFDDYEQGESRKDATKANLATILFGNNDNPATMKQLKYYYDKYIGLSDVGTERLELVNKIRNSESPEERAELLHNLQNLDKSSQYFQGEASQFGNAIIQKLQDKLSLLVPPDMQNVNSLASYGFAVSSSDDTERTHMTEEYQRESLRLQREIRDATNNVAVGSTWSD